METYVSHKEVQVEPMLRSTAQELGLCRDFSAIDEDGYKVIYADGYTSWSPKEPFEDGYTLKEESL